MTSDTVQVPPWTSTVHGGLYTDEATTPTTSTETTETKTATRITVQKVQGITVRQVMDPVTVTIQTSVDTTCPTQTNHLLVHSATGRVTSNNGSIQKERI